jgi:RimJ/RimL family protein N-acetyltransferase
MDLDTPRLRVRDLVREDLDAVHTLLDVDLEMDNRTRDERARWLEWTILGYREHEALRQPPYGDYGIALKGTGELVGLVGLVPSMMPFGLMPAGLMRPPLDRQPYGIPELGLFWAVATEHQRNGYAAEAAAALADFLFTSWHPRRIVATTEHANTASTGVMRRIGMRVDRNHSPAPFFLQIVGVLDNPHGEPVWRSAP